MNGFEYVPQKKIDVFYPFDGQSGIGDFVICAGLCPELAAKYKAIVRFICHDSLKRFNFEYENTEMVYLNDAEFHEYEKTVYRSGSKILYAWFRKDDAGKLVRGNDVNFADEFKKYVFDLPLQAKIHSPSINYEKIKNRIEVSMNKNVEWNKSVVLAPYSSSANKLQNDLLECGWCEKVCKLLKNDYGYNVYTNIKDRDEKPINGSIPLKVCGDELIYVAKACKAFIGVRSGLLDLLSIIGGKVVCVANMGYFHYDLKMMYPDADVTSCYMCWKFIEDVSSRIELNESENIIMKSLNARLECRIVQNVKGCTNQRYCLSYEELSENVMKCVI